jgi:hypothetical protein
MKFWLMGKENRRHFIKCLAVLCIPALFASCSKDSGLGSNVLPPSAALGAYVTDTTTIVSSIKLKDSVLSGGTSSLLLGNYYDPVFGPTKASIYTQLVLPGNSLDFAFGSGVSLDSVVLVLPFVPGISYYGALSPQTITVDTIQRVNGIGLLANHAYYSDTNISHGGGHIGLTTLTPNPLDSFRSVYGSFNRITLPPQIRIKLNKSFGEWMIREDSIPASYNAYFTYGYNFETFIEGFYISVSNSFELPGQGGIMYVNPNYTGAGLSFYYRFNNGGIIDTTVQTFQIGAGCTYFGHFDHDYSKTAFYAGNKDSVLAPNVTYIQAMGGVKTQLSFPYLANWKKLGPVIVNKAEVDVPVNTSATGVDIPPSQAFLVRDSSGTQIQLIDQSSNGLSYYGGTYDATNKQYVFNIERYIQSVLDGKVANTGLYLISGSEAVTANGAVLYGAAKNTNSPRIRLKIYYTPLRR